MPTRWFNQRLPQTLVMSQFLLYFDAFWAALAVLGGGLNFLQLFVLLGSVYGAAGIASEMRRGYRVAVVVSFAPLVLRVVVATGAIGGLLGNLSWVLLQVGGDDPRLRSNVIGAIFQYLLIILLLHTQSREHQRVWFT